MNNLHFQRLATQLWRAVILLCLLVVSSVPQMEVQSAAADGTFQDFDTPGKGTPYAVWKAVDSVRGPELFDNGQPADKDKLMRLAYMAPTPTPTHNGITFDSTSSSLFDQIVADFDFRMRPTDPTKSRADGFGFALLNTANYGVTGKIGPQSVAEEPNFTASLGVGFDIYKSSPPTEVSNNHLSIHFNGTLVQEFDLPPRRDLDLANGQWIHARIIMRPGGGYSDVSVVLTECGRAPITVIDQVKVIGFTPYIGRVYFAARSGGESADHDIDKIRVNFLSLNESVISFNNGCYTAVETDGSRLLTVTRTGNVSGTSSVHYVTSNLSATAPADYGFISGTVTFTPGQTTKTLSLPIVNDSNSEVDESLLVSLSGPSSGTSVGGPAAAKVTIADGTTAQAIGHWSEVIRSDVVPIHMHLLPTGQVLYWDRHEAIYKSDGNPRLWDPTTGTITMAGMEMPTYDLFCSGHSFMSDGRLLVTGGHIADGVGEDNASIYNPFNKTWTSLPLMNSGRWYPSNVTLANGDTLVQAGTFQLDHINMIPQIWQAASGSWRDLTNAPINIPDFADYYPFLYLSPNGKVFDAGPQQTTHYLDTSGTGIWADMPNSMNNTSRSVAYRDYGSSVMYDDGKVLIVGGNPRGDTILPEKSAEVINLNEASPVWRRTNDMNFGRRQLNATLLPDGKVLVTGGSRFAGFDNSDGAVLEAEMWDPATGKWTVMAKESRYRGYHSTALLLLDGRVLVGGGGHPDPTSGAQSNFEIFSPPYLFKGARPTITNAPALVAYGEQFIVKTPNAATIKKMTLVRLSSVTHSFNQNQRYKELVDFSPTPGGLTATVPANPNVLPPGYYMLFILNGNGVPSVGRMIRIDNAVTVSIANKKMGELTVLSQRSQRVAYSVSSGPARISSNVKIVASQRVAYSPNNGITWTSYSELMGLPAHQLTSSYIFPWYNNVDLNSQLRFANVGTTNTTVTITVGGVVQGSYPLAPNASTRVSYPGLDKGPVKVTSSDNVPIIASLRVAYFNGSKWTSFSEMMGLPSSKLTNSYIFPWYNNVDLDSQLRFGNVGTTNTTVTITVGGVVQGNYSLAPNESKRVSYIGLDGGPVKVTSSGNVPIIASLRVAYHNGSAWTDFSEMMGLPVGSLSTRYSFPVYNNVNLNTQLRFANVGIATTTVTVTIGGVLKGSYILVPNESKRVNYAGLDSGPVVIQSTGGVPIIASERVAYFDGSAWTSFSEMMGLPQSQLTTTYLFPWYNNMDLNSQLRFGVP